MPLVRSAEVMYYCCIDNLFALCFLSGAFKSHVNNMCFFELSFKNLNKITSYLLFKTFNFFLSNLLQHNGLAGIATCGLAAIYFG